MTERIDCLLLRDTIESGYTLGKFFIEDRFLGFTCEDTDRQLERNGVKVPRETAIPRGYYRLTADMSNRFKRIMPHILDVPQFDGVRVHGGNTAADTEGCPLLGLHRSETGVYDCKKPNADLLQFIQDTEAAGKEVWLVVR